MEDIRHEEAYLRHEESVEVLFKSAIISGLKSRDHVPRILTRRTGL